MYYYTGKKKPALLPFSILHFRRPLEKFAIPILAVVIVTEQGFHPLRRKMQ